jgi:hypothetical protein
MTQQQPQPDLSGVWRSQPPALRESASKMQPYSYSDECRSWLKQFNYYQTSDGFDHYRSNRGQYSLTTSDIFINGATSKSEIIIHGLRHPSLVPEDLTLEIKILEITDTPENEPNKKTDITTLVSLPEIAENLTNTILNLKNLTICNAVVTFENFIISGKISIVQSHVKFVNCYFSNTETELNTENRRVSMSIICDSLLFINYRSWVECENCIFMINQKAAIKATNNITLQCLNCDFICHTHCKSTKAIDVDANSFVQLIKTSVEEFYFGVYALRGSQVFVSECTFKNNMCHLLFARDAKGEILNSKFQDTDNPFKNFDGESRMCKYISLFKESELVVSSCNFEINIGQGIILKGQSKTEIRDCDFKILAPDNAIYADSCSFFYASRCKFTNSPITTAESSDLIPNSRPSIFISCANGFIQNCVFNGECSRAIAARDFSALTCKNVIFIPESEENPVEIVVQDSTRCHILGHTGSGAVTVSNGAFVYSTEVLKLKSKTTGGTLEIE